MPIKASKLAVDALKPRAVRYDVSITGAKGLTLQVYPTGEKVWTYRTRKDGLIYRERIGVYPVVGLAEAMRLYGALRDQRARGVDLAAKRQRAVQEARAQPTVKELAQEFMERHAKARKRSWPQDERMLAKDVLPAWGRLKAASITRADVVALLDGITDRGAPMQAGKVLALVRKLFNFAIERGVLAANPAARIPRPTPALARDRVLSDAELREVWRLLDATGMRSQVAQALRLQLLTGQRIGEALQAEWSEVDLTARTWLIPAAKSKNRRENLVPLSEPAVELVRSQPVVDRFVFPPTRGGRAIRTEVAAHELAEATRLPDRPLAQALGALGAQPFTSHDLRRTVETRLASLRVPKEVRDRVLNHVDRSVGALHYNRHDYLDEKRAALDAWARLLGDVANDGVTSKVTPIRKARAQV